MTSYRDGFGNRVDLFNVTTPYQELVVQTTSFVRTHRRRPPTGWRAGALARRPRRSRSRRWSSSSRARWSTGPGARRTSSPACPPPTARSAETLAALMAAVAARLNYEKDVTTARTPLGEALDLGRGVCQDFAHLFIGACRGIGLPARYVSGYVNHPGEIATHAWCQVWAGDAVGWVDVDPTHGSSSPTTTSSTAVGRDYSDVPPNRGLWKGRAEETIAVTVKVEPVDRVPLDGTTGPPPPPGRSPRAALRRSRNGRAGGMRQSPGRANRPTEPARPPLGPAPAEASSRVGGRGGEGRCWGSVGGEGGGGEGGGGGRGRGGGGGGGGPGWRDGEGMGGGGAVGSETRPASRPDSRDHDPVPHLGTSGRGGGGEGRGGRGRGEGGWGVCGEVGGGGGVGAGGV